MAIDRSGSECLFLQQSEIWNLPSWLWLIRSFRYHDARPTQKYGIPPQRIRNSFIQVSPNSSLNERSQWAAAWLVLMVTELAGIDAPKSCPSRISRSGCFKTTWNCSCFWVTRLNALLDCHVYCIGVGFNVMPLPDVRSGISPSWHIYAHGYIWCDNFLWTSMHVL